MRRACSLLGSERGLNHLKLVNILPLWMHSRALSSSADDSTPWGQNQPFIYCGSCSNASCLRPTHAYSQTLHICPLQVRVVMFLASLANGIIDAITDVERCFQTSSWQPQESPGDAIDPCSSNVPRRCSEPLHCDTWVS